MKAKKLDELKNKCLKCKKCELGETRNNIVFSDGNPKTARAILIGEAPGENEDKTGTLENFSMSFLKKQRFHAKKICI